MAAGTHLIVTQARDPHADIVSDILRRKGASVVRFHPSDFPLNSGITMCLAHDRPTLSLRQSSGRADLMDVRSV